jgi:hypothetical protein
MVLSDWSYINEESRAGSAEEGTSIFLRTRSAFPGTKNSHPNPESYVFNQLPEKWKLHHCGNPTSPFTPEKNRDPAAGEAACA